MHSGSIVIDGPGQIIAIGDSLTAGSQPGTTLYAPFSDLKTLQPLKTSYPYMLGEMLSPRWGPYLVSNLGRSGSTSREWLPGRSWAKSGMRDFPLNGKPLDMILETKKDIRVCLMMIGTNDANQSVVPDLAVRLMGGVTEYEDTGFMFTRENIITTLILLRKKGIATFLAKIPPNAYRGGLKYLGMDRLFFKGKSSQDRLARFTQTINERIEEVLSTYPDLVKRGPDFYGIMKGNDTVWLQDRLHLNTEGYRLMARLWADHLHSRGIVVS